MSGPAQGDHWLLPLSLASPLSLNKHMHHMARARAVKALREEVMLRARHARIPACRQIQVTLIYVPPDRRRRDSINIARTSKVCEDGLVDAGVVPDDTPTFLVSQMPLIDLPDQDSRAVRLSVLVQRLA